MLTQEEFDEEAAERNVEEGVEGRAGEDDEDDDNEDEEEGYESPEDPFPHEARWRLMEEELDKDASPRALPPSPRALPPSKLELGSG
jgi:hypothetical protein